MEIQSELDSWRYEHREKEAVRFSQRLCKEFPVEVVQPPRAPAASSLDAVLATRKLTREQRASRTQFLHLLQQLDQSEYGEPDAKRQRTSADAGAFAKEDHAYELKRQNEEIRRRLHKALGGHQTQASAPLAIRKLAPRTLMGNALSKPIAARSPRRFASDFQYSTHQKLHKDEIQELEDKLKEQKLTREREADQLVYNWFAERETNASGAFFPASYSNGCRVDLRVAIIVEDVLLDLVYDIAEETFDEVQQESGKKELPPDQLEIVMEALTSGPMERVLIQKFAVDITRRHLQCLHPLQWLNDEVINFWFQLLNDRDEQLVKDGVLAKRSHFFNSFFYSKVSEGGYNFVNVRRWTRKIDLFAMDKVFVPVNISNTHWCLAVIFMTEKRIQYFDSMNGSGAICLDVLFRYLHDEMKHKKQQDFDEQGWELVPTQPDTPQQANGSDCGVFTSIFADYLSRNKPLTFSQKDMEFHRHRMVLHVTQGFLPLDEEL